MAPKSHQDLASKSAGGRCKPPSYDLGHALPVGFGQRLPRLTLGDRLLEIHSPFSTQKITGPFGGKREPEKFYSFQGASQVFGV